MEETKQASPVASCEIEKLTPAVPTVGLFPFTSKGVPDQHGTIKPLPIGRGGSGDCLVPTKPAGNNGLPGSQCHAASRRLYDAVQSTPTVEMSTPSPPSIAEANDVKSTTSKKPIPSSADSPKPSEKYNPDKPPTPTSILMQPYVPFSEKPVKPASTRGRSTSSSAPRGKGKQGAGKGRGVAGKRGKAGKGRGGGRQNTRSAASINLSSDSADSDSLTDAPPCQKRRMGRSTRALDTSPSSGSSGEDSATKSSQRRTSQRRVSFADQKSQSLMDSSTDDDLEEAMGKPTTRRTSAIAASAVYSGKGGQRSSDNDSDDPKDFKRRSTRVAINASKLDKNAMMLMAEEEGRLKEIRLQMIREEEKKLQRLEDDLIFKVPTPPPQNVDADGKPRKGFRRGRMSASTTTAAPRVVLTATRVPSGCVHPPSGPVVPSNYNPAKWVRPGHRNVLFPKTPQEGKSSNQPALDSLEVQAVVNIGAKRKENPICLCGKERDMSKVEFMCCICYCFIHGECTDIDINFDEVCMFMTNYQYYCKGCCDREAFIKRQASFSQMCFTAIATLMQKSDDKEYFSKDKDIIPYLEKNWVKLTTSLKRQKTTWHTTVGKAMAKDDKVFGYGTATKGGDCLVRLLNPVLINVGPNYDTLLNLSGGNFKTFLLGGDLNFEKPLPKPKVSRAMKRKNAELAASRRRGESTIPTKRSIFDYPIDYPFNKDGFRYLFAEQDPSTPHRKAFDASLEWSGRAIPGFLYRLRVTPHMVLALHDRAPQLKVGDDQLTATGDKGYCMVRSTHGVSYGSWYYEVKIKELPGKACTRIGWSQTTANLQAPVGYDKFSYAWRARKGTAFHESIGKHFSDSYGQGDTIGFLIEMGGEKKDRAKYLSRAEYKSMSLMELHRRRKIITETECRYFVKQLVQGCNYLHHKNIIHRDLKLGNLFLNDDMQLKIGDFGLATRIDFNGERKKTMCGTPNYIAPEILGKKGHSFEVDSWSIGCIIYTLLIGKPPFETSCLEDTYSRIQSNKYTIPLTKISSQAASLIRRLLQNQPSSRPNMDEILRHDFIVQGFMPKGLPTSCLTMAPRLDMLKEKHDQLETVRKPLHQISNAGDAPRPLVKQDNEVKEESNKGEMNEYCLTEMYTQLTAVMETRPGERLVSSDEDYEDPASNPVYWISKWVDYSDKYGLGYQLCDNSVGVLFNDTTRLLLTNNGENFQYIEKDSSEKFYTMKSYPENLTKKVTLLKYFRNYMSEHLLKAGANVQPREIEDMVRLPFLRTWFRTRSAMVLWLSNGTIQINFFQDHTKIIVCPLMNAATYIDEKKVFKTYRLKSIEKYGCSKELAARLRYSRTMVERLGNNSRSSYTKSNMDSEK